MHHTYNQSLHAIMYTGGFIESTVDQKPLISLSDDGNVTASVISVRKRVFLHAFHSQLGVPMPLCYTPLGFKVREMA